MAKSKWISDLHWMREGQQSRSQKTQSAILDAAEYLFAESGAENTSVADIAKRAGCSIGSVYHHFKDKKAVMIALYNRMIGEYSATVRAFVDPNRWDGATVKDILTSYIEFAVSLSRNDHNAKKAGLEVTKDDPELREHYHAISRDGQKDIIDILMTRKEQVGHDDPRLAFQFVVDQMNAMLKVRLDADIAPSELAKRSDKVFIRETLSSVFSYLQVK